MKNPDSYVIGIGETEHVESRENFNSNVNMLFMQVPERLMVTDFERVWDLCVSQTELNREEGFELLNQLAELMQTFVLSVSTRLWLTSIHRAVKNELYKTDVVSGAHLTFSELRQAKPAL